MKKQLLITFLGLSTPLLYCAQQSFWDRLVSIQSPEDACALLPFSVENIQKQEEAICNEHDKLVTRMLNHELQPGESLLELYDKAIITLLGPTLHFQLIFNLSSDDAVKEKAQESQEALNEKCTDFDANKELYHILLKHKEQSRSLEQDENFLLEETLLKGERNGLGLENSIITEKLKKLEKESDALELAYSKNVSDDRKGRFLPFTKEELAGISEKDLLQLQGPDEKGYYTAQATFPLRDLILSQCTNPQTRERFFRLFYQIGYPANEAVLQKRRELHAEKAHLMSFSSYASYTLDGFDLVTGSAENARTFIDKLRTQAVPKAQAEFTLMTTPTPLEDLEVTPDGKVTLKPEAQSKFLVTLPADITLSPEGKAQLWDMWRLEYHFKKSSLGIDDNEIKEYFPLDSTMQGLFRLYETFFSVSIQEVPTPANAWHESVRTVEIKDQATQTVIGYVFLDLYPRKNKTDGAFCYSVVPPVLLSKETRSKGACVFIGNFPHPTAESPSLLTHKQATDFFHEFGHSFHTLFGATRFMIQEGVNVATDFLEAPSIFLEYWLLEREVLQKVSSHYKTKEPLPEKLIESIYKTSTVGKAFLIARQIALADASLTLDSDSPEKSIEQVWKESAEKARPFVAYQQDAERFYCSLAPLSAYNLTIFKYLSCMVYASDIFEKVKAQGLFNPEAGKDYREKILAKGGSLPSALILHNYLGREPRVEPFCKRMGL